MSGPLSRALAGLLFVLMLVPGVSAASDDGMLVPDSAHAAAESETASVKRLRLAIVNSYGMSIMDDYYSRTIEAVKEKLTPIEIDVKIYGPDSFLKAAEKESFDMSIASSGLTSLMIERTGGLLDVPAAPDGTQWTISNDNRRLFEVFRVLQVPYGNPDDFGRFVRRILPWVVGAGGVLLILLLNTLLLARLASHRARALEKAMDEKLRAELAAQQNAVQIESLTRASAVGLLSSMVAHELKQPLTVIGNYAGSLRRRLSRGEVPHETLLASITEIEDSGTRAAAIIDRVRSYGQVRTRSLAAVDLSDLVKTAVARWRRHSAHRVPCTLDLEPGLTVEADRLEIELAVLNIVKNAAAAVKDQPDAAIEVTLKADGAYARLCIADNGPELSDEEIARLGDIGYTTTAGGLGLGIAIVHSLLEAHGGSLAYHRRTDLGGRGLVCTVRLPLSGAPEDRTAA